MATPKSLRFLQLAATGQNRSGQTPEQLWKNLGIKKAQFNRDKKALEKIGFIFKYDRKQKAVRNYQRSVSSCLRFDVDRDVCLDDGRATAFGSRRLSADLRCH